MRRIKLNIGQVLAVVLMAVIIVACFRHCYQSGELSTDGEITYAEVLSVDPGTKTSINIYYRFVVNGERFEDSHRALLMIGIRDSLLGRRFPLVFLRGNPKVHRFLLEEKDFNEVGRRQPYNLDWVKRYAN